MKAKPIAWLTLALFALAGSGAALAGGHGWHRGPCADPAPAHGTHGYRHHADSRHGYKGAGHGYGGDDRHGYGRYDRPGHRPAYRRYGYPVGPGYRTWRHGYRKGYRYGYRHGQRRSYYPDAYRYDPLLGHVRGVYYHPADFRGSVSLHFGF